MGGGGNLQLRYVPTPALPLAILGHHELGEIVEYTVTDAEGNIETFTTPLSMEEGESVGARIPPIFLFRNWYELPHSFIHMATQQATTFVHDICNTIYRHTL